MRDCDLPAGTSAFAHQACEHVRGGKALDITTPSTHYARVVLSDLLFTSKMTTLSQDAMRPRLATSPDGAGRPDQHQHQRIWLDMLPSEVNERIATAVCKGKRSTDSLHLAQTSPVQCRAVITALSYTFSLDSVVSDSEMQWINCFIHDARSVTIGPTFLELSSSVRDHALLLLSAPNLQIADMPADRGLLRAAAKAPSLQELTLWVFEKEPQLMDATRFWMQSLGALSLRKLDLRCRAPGTSTCLFRRIETLQDSDYALARCCPKLAAFGSPCLCGCQDNGKSFWTVWSTLPHIREVELVDDPPDWIIPRLRNVKSVRIVDGLDALPLARRLSATVTHLHAKYHYRSVTSRSPSPTGILALSECTRMSQMHMLVDEGEECCLEQVVPSMPSLKSLRLEWLGLMRAPQVIEYHELYDGGGREKIHLTRYKEVKADTMLRVVQQAPCLTHLDILHVRIRVSEVVAILKHLGCRLRHFGVAFHNQHESSVDRFKVILETIIDCNRGLRTVSARLEEMPSVLRIDKLDELLLNEGQVVQLRCRKKMLNVLLRRVRNFVPLLDMESLKSWIRAVQWIDGEEV